MSSLVLFDVPGPKARRRQRIGTVIGGLVVLAVLGACRSLVKIRDDVWLSKVAAGQRLADRGHEPALISRCIAARRGAAPPEAAEARAFQHRVLDEIQGR